MTINNEPQDATIDTPVEGEREASQSQLVPTLLFMTGLVIVVSVIMSLLMAANAASHPYTGTGTIKSHTPWGSAQCNITVVEENGAEHTYKRMGGMPYCSGIEDGSQVEIKDGTIEKITAP